MNAFNNRNSIQCPVYLGFKWATFFKVKSIEICFISSFYFLFSRTLNFFFRPTAIDWTGRKSIDPTFSLFFLQKIKKKEAKQIGETADRWITRFFFFKSAIFLSISEKRFRSVLPRWSQSSPWIEWSRWFFVSILYLTPSCEMKTRSTTFPRKKSFTLYVNGTRKFGRKEIETCSSTVAIFSEIGKSSRKPMDITGNNSLAEWWDSESEKGPFFVNQWRIVSRNFDKILEFSFHFGKFPEQRLGCDRKGR